MYTLLREFFPKILIIRICILYALCIIRVYNAIGLLAMVHGCGKKQTHKVSYSCVEKVLV